MLNVQALSVHYGRVQAVREATLTVKRGEIVALLGANGAGKSTLLQAIVGLVRPSAGQMSWNDARLDTMPTHRVSRAGVALVPEGRQMLASLSVRDNLLLGAYHELSRSPTALMAPMHWVLTRPIVRERLANVNRLFPRLAERHSQMAGSLSGGEQQMLAIGRALLARPKLLLLDEPSMGLAPRIVREILDHIARLRTAHGMTILLVEQNARGALAIADRGYVLETGRVILQGTSEELLANRDVQRAYLGRDAGETR